MRSFPSRVRFVSAGRSVRQLVVPSFKHYATRRGSSVDQCDVVCRTDEVVVVQYTQPDHSIVFLSYVHLRIATKEKNAKSPGATVPLAAPKEGVAQSKLPPELCH